MKHIIEAQQFDEEMISKLFTHADLIEQELEAGPIERLRGKILASLFYEPSTRTRFSFESAMIRLGGNVLTTENAAEFSSAFKGESLEDTIRVVSHYADIIVLRHFDAGASQDASNVSSVPILNAGDGAGQHPTQALLDLYTIHRTFDRTSNISIAMVGDLKNGRTVRSLCYLIGKYTDNTIQFISPKELTIGNDIKEYLKKHHVSYNEYTVIEDVVDSIDVLYQTRIQKERFNDEKEYERLKNSYRIDKHIEQKLKKDAIIMHPLPRVDEIAPEIDDSPKARYFTQAYYGLLIRMALLDTILSA